MTKLQEVIVKRESSSVLRMLPESLLFLDGTSPRSSLQSDSYSSNSSPVTTNTNTVPNTNTNANNNVTFAKPAEVKGVF
jgi:hypothetical protein